MVEKDGKESEEEAKKAYRAASEDGDHAVDDSLSSALIDRVRSSAYTCIHNYKYLFASSNYTHFHTSFYDCCLLVHSNAYNFFWDF